VIPSTCGSTCGRFVHLVEKRLLHTATALSKSSAQTHTATRPPPNPNHHPQPPNTPPPKACAYGDFDALRRFVEAAPSCVNAADEQGYIPLQWAALNNRVAECTYLLTNGADVAAADPTGQTALHWAAVRGSLPVLETLLRNGADASAADARGYTVCHVAAQYGQTAVLFHLAMKWGVDVDAPDHDGRTPLHWVRIGGASGAVGRAVQLRVFGVPLIADTDTL